MEIDLIKSLAKYNLKPVQVARFKRNSDDIDNALTELRASGVTATSLVGTYQPLSDFINKAQQNDFIVNYTSVSFSSSSELFKRIKSSANLMVTEVLPDPLTCQSKWCHTFTKDMANAGVSSANRLLFEGYLNAAAFSIAAKKCTPALNRLCLKKQLSNLSILDKELFTLFNHNLLETSMGQHSAA